MPTTQEFYEGGKFVFRSGVVATDEDYVVLHVNKTTGEKSLPQGLCEWVPKPHADKDAVPVLESFEATAQRIVDTQLTHKSRLEGHNPIGSPQPYPVKSGVRPKMNAPFLLQTDTTPDGTIQVTAWFRVFFDSDDPVAKKVAAYARGQDWVIKLVRVCSYIEGLSKVDHKVLDKAVNTRKIWSPYEDDDLNEFDSV